MLLRNVTGVDMAQTGVNRYEVVLRGFNNVFTGATYVMTDYRRAAVASLGLNDYSLMPISQIDLERIEVVRGPGSALFGAGVDAGVIHFISKDPFTHPGTTVRVGGGLRNALTASLRHAGVRAASWVTRSSPIFSAPTTLPSIRRIPWMPYNSTRSGKRRFPSITITITIPCRVCFPGGLVRTSR